MSRYPTWIAPAAMAVIGLAFQARAENPLPALDDPPVSISFQAGSGLDSLNQAISKYLSKRPGLTRYSGFQARLDGIGMVLLPEAFTGTVEQLIKAVACINNLGYRDFGPDGVVFALPSAEHPKPKCPEMVTTDDVRRKAMTLPGNPAGLRLPGRQGVERLFPGYTKPSPLGSSVPGQDRGDAPPH